MTAPRLSGRILLAGALLLLAGCHHAPLAATGTSSFEEVRLPAPQMGGSASAKPTEARAVDFEEAQAIRPLLMPVYPADALAARAGWAQVGVHVTVDVAGKVGEVSPSLFLFSTPGRFAAAFREAVETAVRQWRFRPAAVLQLETVPMPGGGSYSRIKSREATEAQFDLVFTFTATGGVVGGAPGK